MDVELRAGLDVDTLVELDVTAVLQYEVYVAADSDAVRILAVIAGVALSGVVMFTDRNGLYCLVTVSACMSLMFPTIYGIALHGVGDNVKFAGAGLIMAILGGSFFPPLQALIIDWNISVLGLPATNISFVVPLLSFVAVALYGHRSYVRMNITHKL